MALSEELPIYKSCYDLLEQVVELSGQLPKLLRYSMGQRMIDIALEMLSQVYRANMSQRGRYHAIGELLIGYRQLQMLLRVCYRRKAMSTGRYAALITLLDNIGRQATGWRNKYEEEK